LSSRTPSERSLNIYDSSHGQLFGFGIFLLCISWTLARPRPSLIFYLYALRSSSAKTIITLIFSKDSVVFLLQNRTPAYCICFLSRRIVLKKL
jgi:hypothetical protein